MISLLIITGCPFQANVNVDASKEADDFECKNRGADYIDVAGNCCLDENHNNKCDKEESKAPCDDECSEPICSGDNKKIYYDCVKKEDGCKSYEPKGMLLEKCGIQCFSEDDCKSDERCFNNKCEKDRCDDGVQGTYENCENCPKDFLKEGLYCCNKQVIKGSCCSDVNCDKDEICENNVCKAVPKCGDSICQTEIGENCGNCTVDCQTPKDNVCCSGNIVQGNCCTNEQCKVNEACISNLCTAIEQPVNETTTNQTNSS